MKEVKTIRDILIERDGLTPEVADEMIADYEKARQEELELARHNGFGVRYIDEGAILEDSLGLEPDYLEYFGISWLVEPKVTLKYIGRKGRY